MLRRFLDTFGFDYEFASATDYYTSGQFDAVLLKAAEKYDAIMKVMLPTLGPERQATYSPFLPISPKSGRVLYVPMKAVDAKAGTITFDDEGRHRDDAARDWRSGEAAVEAGLRHAMGALGVDFEMFGKDHQTNAAIYDRICEILGGRAPEHFRLRALPRRERAEDLEVEGNGLTIDEWLTYAPTESLALYMFQRPRQAKKLYFDVIPKAVDGVLHLPLRLSPAGLEGTARQPGLAHPWRQPARDRPSRALRDAAQPRQRLECARQERALGLHLALCARNDAPRRTRNSTASSASRSVFRRLREALEAVPRAGPGRAGCARGARRETGAAPRGSDGETIQNAALDVARAISRYQDPAKKSPDGGPGVSGAFFQMIYQVLIGQERGPRFGSFAALYGVANTRRLIEDGLAGRLAA